MKSIINELHPDSYKTLFELYNSEAIFIKERNEHIFLDKTVRISPDQGQLIRILCQRFNVKRTLEIGFAYGFSTIWILDALRYQPTSSHISIDPFENSMWGGVGLSMVSKLKYNKNFQWIEEFSIHALSSLMKNNEKFDLIFIDGSHRFDDVILDFYLCDYVLLIGGIIIFDDMWLPSIRKVVDFIKTNRAYELIETTVTNVAAFRKLGHDGRNWDHFIPF